MITEPSSSVVPQEIVQNIESVHAEVEKLQRELTQAQEVWQSTLTEEKNTFAQFLEHKELAWQEQDSQWARQSQVYEERLAEMKFEFESRLKQTDQAAARALAELDDAWQRDKLEWGPAARAEWPAQRRDLEAKTQNLEGRLAELEGAREAERTALEARIQELESRPPAEAAGPNPEIVRALQTQLLDFQQTVASLQDRSAQSDELIDACLQALDYQISVLYDLVYHFMPPAPDENASSDLAQS